MFVSADKALLEKQWVQNSVRNHFDSREKYLQLVTIFRENLISYFAL